MTEKKKQTGSKFTKHAEADSALAPKTAESETGKKKGMKFAGKVAVFFVFPAFVGGVSFMVGLIEKRRNPDYDLNLDRDFMFPFVIALVLSMVVTLQTKGFTKDKPEPLVSWPKVRKNRTVVHKYVVKGKTEEEPDKKND